MKKNLHKKEDMQKLASLFFTMRGLIKQRFASCYKQTDPSGWLDRELLLFIEMSQGPSMQQVTDYLHVRPSSASSLVTKLQKVGFVRRTAGKDKRSIHLFLTVAGKKELKKRNKVSEEVLKEVFGALSVTELHTLMRLLESVTKRQG